MLAISMLLAVLASGPTDENETLLLTATAARTAEPPQEPPVVAKPEAFETLVHPNCSHCLIEANRCKDELRSDDRVLCWIQVQSDGYINDGAIPLRFFPQHLSDPRRRLGLVRV